MLGATGLGRSAYMAGHTCRCRLVHERNGVVFRLVAHEELQIDKASHATLCAGNMCEMPLIHLQPLFAV